MLRNIVIVDDEPITRMDVLEILEEAGYNVVGQAIDGFDAVELCRKYKPDLVIMDVKMPLLDGIQASKVINEENLAGGVLLLTAYSDKSFINQATNVGVLGYLVKPIVEKSLIPAVEVALSRADEFLKIKTEAKKITERYESRIIIEKAKGILIINEGFSEDKAYNYIRKLSMDKRCSMKKIAEMIVLNTQRK